MEVSNLELSYKRDKGERAKEGMIAGLTCNRR
jgi:hypothetical protein